MTQAAIDQVLELVRESRRYRSLHEAALRRVAERALEAEQGDVRRAAKRAKRSLHQMFGAYLPDRPRYARLLAKIRAAADEVELRGALSEAMREHASTRERFELLEGFYREVFARVGPVRRVLDLACGLNPLAFPWMALAPGTRYVAADVDTELVEFVRECLRCLGADADARVLDVVSEAIDDEADVALLLKLLPCLERQDPGAPVKLLRSVRAPWLVVSFPTRSIGGRQKGMLESYSGAFERLAARERFRSERLEFAGELVYVVDKSGA